MRISSYRCWLPIIGLVLLSACSSQRKLEKVRAGKTPEVQLALTDQKSNLPEIVIGDYSAKDTLTIFDDGKEILLMKAVKDEETGDMVATDVLEAAKVTARFRNVAERDGKVDIAFQIIVPEEMMDSKWQLRFHPEIFMLGDSARLEPVIITGNKYRKTQLKGYQQYNRFMSKIIEDTTAFINVRSLEIFLKRNIPEIYAFRDDSSYVSDEEFYSVYGVSKQQAVEHYTNKHAKKMNARRRSKRDAMYRKYVKAPIITEGIRLDSVVVDVNGDFIYNYVQPINTRPKLKKANVVLAGEIFEQEQRLYTIPKTDSLTFYISSLAAFADQTQRYLTKVVERRASANTECKIDFEVGRSEMKENFSDNMAEINRIKETLASLIKNDVYDLDSIDITATASPEGSWQNNRRLAEQRSVAVTDYFRSYVKDFTDELVRDGGFFIDSGHSGMRVRSDIQKVVLTPKTVAENWEGLHRLVEEDMSMNVDQKESYRRICQMRDPDRREDRLKSERYYSYMKSTMYPKLRTVHFNFYLHRKGMVKDTIHTTVLDSVYMRGVQALRDMDYYVASDLLAPYKDYNTAVAYVGTFKNRSALNILKKLEPTAPVNYLTAVIYSRLGKLEKAVEYYLQSCRQDPSYVYRGNLDPEISVLISTYGLNRDYY